MSNSHCFCKKRLDRLRLSIAQASLALRSTCTIFGVTCWFMLGFIFIISLSSYSYGQNTLMNLSKSKLITFLKNEIISDTIKQAYI